MMAHDIFGFTLPEVRQILADYREQIPHAEAMRRRMTLGWHTRLKMLDLLRRVERLFGGADSPDSVLAEIRLFLKDIESPD